MIQTLPPMTMKIHNTVKMPAPALSAVVIFDVVTLGEALASLPALGSPFEVPPVLIDLGAIPELICVAPITLSACICKELVKLAMAIKGHLDIPAGRHRLFRPNWHTTCDHTYVHCLLQCIVGQRQQRWL